MTVPLVEQEEQPLGFAYAGQGGPRQEGGRPVRGVPRDALDHELVLVHPALPHAADQRAAGLATRRQPPHPLQAPHDEQQAQAGPGGQFTDQELMMSAARRGLDGCGPEQHHPGGQQHREQDAGGQPGPAEQADYAGMGHYLAYVIPAKYALENRSADCFRHRHTF